MPERETVERARQDAREGKAPTTQAGEFVREEMRHIREGRHRARSTKQAMPPKVTRDQAIKFAKSPARGEPNRRRIALTVLSDKVRELV